MKAYVIINAIMEKSIVLNGKEAGKPIKSSSLSKKKNDAKKVSSAGAKTEKKSVPQLKTKNSKESPKSMKSSGSKKVSPVKKTVVSKKNIEKKSSKPLEKQRLKPKFLLRRFLRKLCPSGLSRNHRQRLLSSLP